MGIMSLSNHAALLRVPGTADRKQAKSLLVIIESIASQQMQPFTGMAAKSQHVIF